MEKIIKDYRSMMKKHKAFPQQYEIIFKKYLAETKILFDVAAKNVFDLIRADEKRDEDAKNEDILFLTEYRNGKIIKFGGLDRNFHKRAEMAQNRLEEFQQRLDTKLEAKERLEKKEMDRIETEDATVELEISNDSSDNEDIVDKLDEDFEPTPSSSRKRNCSGKENSNSKVIINASVADVLENWAPFIARYKVGTSAATALLNSVFSFADKPLEALSTSYTTVFRKNAVIIETEANILREEQVDRCRG